MDRRQLDEEVKALLRQIARKAAQEAAQAALKGEL